MPCRLEGGSSAQRATSWVYLLTIHYHLHILDKTVNDLEGLCCGYPSLILGESIQSLEHRLYVLLSKELLNKLFCVALSQVI